MESITPRIPLSFAQKIAAKIIAELSPFCEKIEVAGSIRRERPLVGDIDLVCIPSNRPALRYRVKKNAVETSQDGDMNLTVVFRSVLGTPIQLDLWMAKPSEPELFGKTDTNFGSVLLCRTGSIEHNIWLIDHAIKLGLTWNPYYGVFDRQGQCLASSTEEAIYQALHLEFIPPQQRERSRQL